MERADAGSEHGAVLPVRVDGLVVTTAVRSLCFEVRYARHPWAAVATIDMAAHHDLVSLEELAAYVDLHPSWAGIEQARATTRLGDENAWSPPEVPRAS